MNAEYINSLLQSINDCYSTNQNIIRAAENQIDLLIQNSDFLKYSIYLLQNPGVTDSQKMMLAVLMKNHIKKYWKGSDEIAAIDDSIKHEVRNSIIGIMLQSNNAISRLISDAIAIIAESDYPNLWPRLFDDLKAPMNVENIELLARILDCANCIIRKYYGKDDSQENLLPVRQCLDTFGIYLYDLWTQLIQKLQNTSDAQVAFCIYQCLGFVTSIFSSLCWFDLPDIFEDKIQEWMSSFMEIIQQESPNFGAIDDENPVDRLKANIVEILSQIPYKSDYVYTEYYEQINSIIWQILQNKTYLNNPKFRPLYVNGLKFLNSSIKFNQAQNTNMDSVITNIIQTVIIPVLACTEEREYTYEDTPYQYVQYLLEGETADSIEQACHQLFYTLQTNYTPLLVQLFHAFLATSNELYSKDRTQGWISREVVLLLYIYIHSGFQTTLQGTKKINSNGVDLNSFITDIILPDLQASEGQVSSILLTREICFCLYFRHLITTTIQYTIFSSLLPLLSFNDPAVHTIAAITIDRYLYLKDTVLGQPLFTSANLSSSVYNVLTILFTYINEPTISILHHYFLKTLASVIIVSKKDIEPYTKNILDSICSLLNAYATNNDIYPLIFVHYLFESLSALIKVSAMNSMSIIDSFYSYLFTPLSTMLNNSNNDIVSYILQILAYLLEIDTSVQLRDGYKQLYPQLINPSLWSTKGNVKPLVRFISAYCYKAPDLVSSKILTLLNIFRDLLIKNAFRYDGLDLLEAFIVYLPLDTYKNYIDIIYQLLFGQLSRVQVAKYSNTVLYILSILTGLYGCEITSTALLSKMGNQGYIDINLKLLIYTSTLSDPLIKKSIVVGLCRLIYEEPFYKTPEASQLAIATVASLVNMLENPSVTSELSPIFNNNTNDDEDFEFSMSFSSYHALSIAATPHKDPFPTVQNYTDTLNACIKVVCSSIQGDISNYMDSLSTVLHHFDSNKVKSYIQTVLRS